MIPVRLTLKGIYSYQKEHTIEFDRLLEGQLFGIFGTVGSGKSTILEAISFALYGESERLNQRDNRGYNMMNLKSHELLIDFTFTTGQEPTEYRFLVQGKRSKKHFEKVQTFERKAFKKENGNWEPVETGTAKEIIGLSYENFRRTIIIPQGKFQEFLQLGDKDRTQMLKEIFQLERFELFYKVASLERINQDEQLQLETRRERFEAVSGEAIEGAEKELEVVRKKVKALQEKKEKLEKEERAFSKLKDLFEKLEQCRQSMKELQKQEKAFQEREHKLKAYEYCLIHFKDLLEKQENEKVQIDQLRQELKTAQETLDVLQEQLKEEEDKFQRLKKQYDQKDDLVREKEELNKIIEIIQLEGEMQQLSGRVEKGWQHCQKQLDELTGLEQKYKRETEAIKQLKQALPDMNELSEIRNWFTIKNNHLQIIKEGKEKVKLVSKALKTLEQEIPVREKADLPDLFLQQEARDIHALISDMEQEGAQIRKEIDELTNRLEHYNVQAKLEEYAKSLKEGEPCPLCGSEHHPETLNAEDVKMKLAVLVKEREQKRERFQQLEEQLKQCRALQLQIEQKKEVLDEHQINLKIAEGKLNDHLKIFIWKRHDANDEDSLKAAFSKAKALNDQIKVKDEEQENLLKKTGENRKLLEKYQKALEDLRKDFNNKEARKNILLSQLKQLSFKDHKTASAEHLAQKIEGLENKLKKLKEGFLQSEEKVQQLRGKKDALSGQVKEGQKNLAQFEVSHINTNELVEQKVKDSQFGSLKEIMTVLQQELDVEAERKAIGDYKQELHAVKKQLEALSKESEGKKFDHEQYDRLMNTLREAEDILQKENDELIRQQTVLDKMKGDLKEKLKVEKELEKAKERGEDIKVMKQLFKGSGFVNYISSVYLQNLCNAANERFYQLTRQKLRLEVTEDNNFQVRDFLNDGQVRSVKTLSGGQTFQASLSLALALAESVQQQNKIKENFFFLDEGFGSQDKESLQIVFESLKSLRKENRIVGIISHVEELQQEIDVHLKIRNDEESGSLIKASWE